MRIRYWHVAGISVALLFGSTQLQAQSTSETTKPEVASGPELGSTATSESLTARSDKVTRDARVQLTIYPAKLPTPELRYKLWPQPRDLTAGEAQTSFYRALLMLQSKPDESLQKLDEWFGLPLNELPLEKVEAELSSYSSVFEELDRMALCENQTLDFRIREMEGDKIYYFLLPETQEARTLARLLKLKSAVEVQKGDYAAAIETWKTTFRLAGLVGSSDIIVSQLVAVAVASQAFESIEAAMVRPDCPNLYWALATIPRPLVNFRQSVAVERDAVFQVFPLFRDAEQLQLTPDEWQRRLTETFAAIQKLHGEIGPDSSLEQRIKLTMLLAFAGGSDSAAVRQRLQAAGWSEKSLANMPIHQLVALDTAQQLRYWSDRTFAPYLLPGDLARPVLAERMREMQEWIQRERGHSMAAHIIGLLLPALHNVHEASLRSELILNQLMTIEAIRMQMASDGRLPSSLNDLRLAPALIDPSVGQPFEYTLSESSDGATAILKSRGATDAWPAELKERRLTAGRAR